MKRALAVAGSVAARLLLVLPSLVAFGALAAPGGTAATVLAALLGIGALAALVLLRPLWKCAAAVALLVAPVFVWFASQEPRSDRDWQPDVSRMPFVERDGDRVTVRDLRDFDWTGPDTATPRWTTRTFDLSELRSVDLVLSYWDGNTSICHTMFSFGFADGRRLALSVETRKEVGESYSAWRGFFHQYELIYVLAEESDVIGVRAAHRGEDLFLYTLRATPEIRRRLLEDVLATVDSLSRTPRWYGALRANCTTTLQSHVDVALGRAARFRWDTMLNGRIDEKAWRLGAIEGAPAGSGTIEELRAAHRITDAAKAAAGRPGFSEAIRARGAAQGR